ncbi:MAG: hypothetical protein WC976_05875 [Caldisericia bacterium]
MKKIWDVEIGNNFSQHTVEAKNFTEAGKKALQSTEATGKEKWVSKVECVREVES